MITFIVRTYNSQDCVLDCLRSIDNQTVYPWRCVVVDDGSTDETVALVRSFVSDDVRYTFVQEPANLGPTHALLVGLSHCDTEWWAVVDSDDILHPNAVEVLNKYLASFPTPVMVYSPYLVQYTKNTSPVPGPTYSIPWSFNNLLQRHITQQLCVYRTDVTGEVGWVNLSYKLAADYDLSLRVAAEGKVIKVPVSLYTKRLYLNGVSQRRRGEQVEFCCRAVREAHERRDPSKVYRVTHDNGTYVTTEV